MKIVIEAPDNDEILRAALFVNDQTWKNHQSKHHLLGGFTVGAHEFCVTRIKGGLKARYVGEKK
jgi:hypothetical protein